MDFKVRYLITADNRQAKQAFQEISNLQQKGGRGGSSMGDVFGGNLAADAVSRMTSKLYEGGSAVLDYASKLEQTRIAFGTLMGSAEAANKHIEDLMMLSRQSALDFPSIAKMSQRLQGAGLQAENLTGLIKDIGNISAATGELTADRMEGIGVAISQIFSKGKVSAEEMEQLAERGVPAWKILSATLEKTTGETRKLAEEGKITSQQFIDAFQKFSRLNYGDAMERQAATFSGATGKITNIMLDLASTAFQPWFDKVSRFADDTADSLSDQEARMGKAGISFGMALGEGIGEGIRRAQGGQGWAQWFFENVMFSGVGVGKWAFNTGYDIAAGIDKGMKSFDETAVLGGRTMRINPQTFTLEEVPGAAGPGLKTPPPGASDTAGAASKKAEQDAEKQRRDAERLAERDLQAGIRLAEMYLASNRDAFETWFGEIRTALAEGGSLETALTDQALAVDGFTKSIAKNIKEIEALENRELSSMTANEKALLRAKQLERINDAKLQKLAAEKAILGAIEEGNDNIAGKVIARYEAEGKVAAELERQNKALDESMKKLLMMPGMDQYGNETMKAPEGGSAGGFFGEGGFGSGLDDATGRIRSMDDVMQQLGKTAEDVFMSMGAGLGAMVESWVLLGDQADVSMKKMVASVLAGVAAQAATLSIFHLAMGLAALTPWGAAMYGPAPLHFKAAAIWGAIAVGTALAGRAVAGDSFKSGGKSGSGSGSGSSRGQDANQTPISRFNENTWVSGRNTEGTAFRQAADAINRLEQKISSMRPGDVVTVGAKQSPGAIAEATVQGVRTNSAYGTNLKRAMGDR